MRTHSVVSIWPEDERDRKRNDEHHVGDDQYQTQGQGLEKSDGHDERT